MSLTRSRLSGILTGILLPRNVDAGVVVIMVSRVPRSTFGLQPAMVRQQLILLQAAAFEFRISFRVSYIVK